MKFVLDLQAARPAANSALSDSPSTLSLSFCFSTHSVILCAQPTD